MGKTTPYEISKDPEICFERRVYNVHCRATKGYPVLVKGANENPIIIEESIKPSNYGPSIINLAEYLKDKTPIGYSFSEEVLKSLGTYRFSNFEPGKY